MRSTQLSQSQAMMLTPGQAQAQRAVETQQSITSFPYYSTVVFRAPRTPFGTPQSADQYVFPQGQVRRAFAYAKGQSWQIAGATDAVDGFATLAETNLAKANETISGEAVEIVGLGLFIKPGSTDGDRFTQAKLLAQIASNVSVELSLNGDQNRYTLGTLQQLPGAGGLLGVGHDETGFLPGGTITQSLSPDFPFETNGWPTRSNYYRMPEGVIWQPAGIQDSMLNLIFTNTREFRVITGGIDRPQLQVSATAPFSPETICAVIGVQLMGRVVSPRTRIT